MKRQNILAGFLIAGMSVFAQGNEWKDPGVNAVNRLPMHSHYFAYENSEVACNQEPSQSSNFMTLNGAWKFYWVKDSDIRPTDFYKNLKSASNLNGNLNCSKELEHYAS